MFTLKVENASGEMFTLTGREDQYQILNIEGLSPPKAQINLSTMAGVDGARFNSSKLDPRNIVILIKINGDVETNRNNLYRFFKTKDFCRIYFANKTHDVSIDGYVDSFECNFFTNSEVAQISVVCPFPFFRSAAEVTETNAGIEPLFEFPFAIDRNSPVVISRITGDGSIAVYNASDSECGTAIEINFKSACSSVQLTNTRTGEGLELDFAFAQGDTAIINTTPGQKSIELVRDGAVSSLFSALKAGSKFFGLLPGLNVFDCSVDGAQGASAVQIIFKFRNTYRGV